MKRNADAVPMSSNSCEQRAPEPPNQQQQSQLQYPAAALAIIPVLDLPPEALAQIVQRAGTADRSAWRSLGLVCQQWRDASLALPRALLLDRVAGPAAVRGLLRHCARAVNCGADGWHGELHTGSAPMAVATRPPLTSLDLSSNELGRAGVVVVASVEVVASVVVGSAMLAELSSYVHTQPLFSACRYSSRAKIFLTVF